MKHYFTLLFIVLFFTAPAQKHVFDVILLGKKIGTTVVERIDKGNGEIEYKLNSNSKARIFFADKISILDYDVIFKNGKLFSSYCKIVKDDAVEVVTIAWDGAKYMVKRNEERLEIKDLVDFTALMMYFVEPVGKKGFFSERLATMINFIKTGSGTYECKVDNGVINTYYYQNGKLVQIAASKGLSVIMKLVQ